MTRFYNSVVELMVCFNNRENRQRARNSGEVWRFAHFSRPFAVESVVLFYNREGREGREGGMEGVLALRILRVLCGYKNHFITPWSN
jgi:hypothetical protein